MVVVPYSSLEPGYADYLIENQKLMNANQREMSIGSPHLVWVTPRSRNLPKALRLEIYERDEGRCAYCECSLPIDGFTVDHIHPVCQGGGDEPDNLTVACRPCNSSKGGR